MYLGEMITEVKNIVDDASYSDAQVVSYINLAVQYAAAQVNIPGLKKIFTATTSTTLPYTSLTGVTGGFSGRLLRISNMDVSIYPNLQMLMDEYVSEDYPDLTEAGDLEAVALEGSTLWYQYVPAAEVTVTMLGYQNPPELEDSADIPSDFPSHLHRPLFVNGAAWLIFDQIEDGLEGEKVNTQAHFMQSFSQNNKHSGIVKLYEWIGKNRTHWKSSVWRY
jgi:hypothetical protein